MSCREMPFGRSLGRVAVVAVLLLLGAPSAPAVILWSDLGATLIHDSGNGGDILGGAVRRDDQSSDTLYFKFHLDPLSDVSTEEYSAAFQLFEGNTERLAVGNSLKAWAYSAFNTAETGEGNRIFGDLDLHSARPESSAPGVFLPYELPRRGIENTIVFKVQFVPGGDDLVTVWLNPDLSAGATEENQPDNLITKFRANAGFDQIRLRHNGGGGGWTFSDLAVATAFSDLVQGAVLETDSGSARGSSRMTFRAWQREQGLPQNSVHALAQTPDGYLWVGGDNGVARFDGVRFVSFGSREGLRAGRVRVLYTDHAGDLWIGIAGGGLTRFRAGEFSSFGVSDGLPSGSITALREDNQGVLWIGSESGLATEQDGRITALPAAREFKGHPVTALMKDSHGAMWVGIGGVGVFRFAQGKWIRLSDVSVEGLLQDPHCLLEDKQGRIWMGVGEDVVLCKEGDQWRRYRVPRHLANPYVGSLVADPSGTVWAGSVSEGLFQFKDGKLSVINASSGLSDNFVEALLVDREGNLWVGTSSGLNRVGQSNLSVFGQNEGLGYGPVWGMAEIAPHVLWACKPRDGIFRWEGRNFNRLAEGDTPWRATEASSLLVARDGGCWVAGAQGVAHFKEPNAALLQPDQVALTGRNITALLEDAGDGLWAGSKDGELWRFHGGEWDKDPARKLGHAITSLAQSHNGSLWVGTEGDGLFRFGTAELMHFDKRNGLVSDSIRTLHLDEAGVLWIGTAGGGLSRWRDGQIKSFSTREGLSDDSVSQIIEDDSQRLWLGTSRGILCVAKRELDDFSAGRLNLIYPRIYGHAEGMPSEECTSGFCPAGLRTKSGSLWFSTLKGIVVADPHQDSGEAPAPSVVLEEVWVDGSPIDARELARLKALELKKGPSERKEKLLEIGPGKRRLEFYYTALSFTAPERVRFRYRLEGLDAGWVEAGVRRSVLYNYVPHGEYRFRVMARNGSGIWSESGSALTLRVLPHFWEARWFIVLVILATLGGVAGMVRLLEQRAHQRQLLRLEQERALERERSRIAQDLHDDLGSSLTRLSLVSELLKADKYSPSQVELHAKKISQSTGQTVRALDEIVWALRPGSDTLQSLIEYIAHFASELFEGDTTRCRLDLPQDLPARPLPPEMRHNIFLVIKEALTNALKHAGAKEVQVVARATNTLLEIEVKDDGRGFNSRKPPVSGKHQGLGNMQSRAAAMGGVLNVESRAQTGTSVTLAVKLPAQPPV